MLDTIAEVPIPLAEAAKLIPPARGGKKTHLSTLLRWITRGVRNPNGETIYLDGIRIGNRWMTSREALQRFAERLTPAVDAPLPTPTNTATARQRASERAARALDRIGI